MKRPINFDCTRLGDLLENIALVEFSESGKIKSISFVRPVYCFTREQFAQLANKLEIAENDQKRKSGLVLITGPDNIPKYENLPSEKMNLVSAMKFVFQGGGGLSSALERFKKLVESSESEMSEKDKAAFREVINGFKKLDS